MNKFPEISNYRQTIEINELLGASESYYNLSDVFRILPSELQIGENIAICNYSHLDITYTFTRPPVVECFVRFDMLTDNLDIYDAFIEAIKWLQKNNYDICG
jgi:hypothetical protein